MPVFWVALLLGVISVLLMNPTVANPNAQAINGDLLFSVFGIAEIIRFFGVTALYPGNGPLSTVAVEMLLYASYPLFLFIHKLYGLIALLLFGLFLYSSIIFARMLGIDPLFLQGTWFEFVLYWLIGAVSAGFYVNWCKKTGNKSLIKKILIVASGYLFYLLLISFVHIKGFYVVTTLLLALLTGASLIILLTLESKLSKRQTKIAAIMAIVGARSYSLYVVHTPVIFITIWFFSKYTSLPELSYSVLTLMVVFIATELMFRFVEKPSHRYAQHWR